MFYAEEMFIKIDSENAFLIAMKKKKYFCIGDLTRLYWDLKSFHQAKIQTHFTILAGI